MNFLKYSVEVLLSVVIVVAGLFTVRIGMAWQSQREWFGLQARQLATVRRLGEYPPAGWNKERWENALVTPYNVWGSVTYHPNYSKLSNDEMRALLSKLDQIVAETTGENSIASVDKVFALMMTFSEKTHFISGYRDQFRTYDSQFRHRPDAAEPPHPPESATGSAPGGESSPPAR